MSPILIAAILGAAAFAFVAFQRRSPSLSFPAPITSASVGLPATAP